MAVRKIQIDARGMRFDALTAGPRDGELVLLLHGFPQSASCWRPALTTLGNAGFRAVAVTQRGYSAGAMPEGVEAYHLSELCDDVMAIAKTLERERFHVIGHDWGGVVAWRLAAEHSDALATLTAVSTPHGAALRSALQNTRQRVQMSYIAVLRWPRVAEVFFDTAGGAMVEAALAATGLSRAHARRDVAALRRVGATGALNWYRAITRGALRQTAPVDVPTLHIWGDRDVAFSRLATEQTVEHVSGPYHLLELEGASHWIPDEHWDDAKDVVLEHLTSNRIASE